MQQKPKVKSSKHPKALLAAFIAFAIVVIIFVFVLSGHDKKTKKIKSHSQVVMNDNLVFQKNQAHLSELMQQQNKTISPVVVSLSSAPKENKEMSARRNSPTQMYLAGSSGASMSQNGPLSKVTQALGIKNQSKPTVLAGKNQFVQFANEQNTDVVSVLATQLKHPDFTVAQGEFIHAALETAVNSDLPGMVRAVVTEPVYAYLGDRILIPGGSRLIGQYTSLSSNGSASERVFVVWNRIITPQGISLLINSPGSDALGRAGMGADATNTHFWKIFGTASLLSMMSATAANVDVGAYDQPNSANMYRQSIATAFQQSAESSLKQNTSIKPTLHIYQGDEINIFVARDIDLYKALKN